MHALPGMQSLSVWHGHAHFCAATLQRWVKQLASAVQGRARGLGVDSAAFGAAGAAASTGVAVAPVGGAGAGA